MTRVVYGGEPLARIERKDGVNLAVYSDDVGNPRALEITGLPLGAAFVWDSERERSNFVDQVKLRFQNGRYVGFEPTPMTQRLFGVDPNDVIATIARNFIKEGDKRDYTSHLLPEAPSLLAGLIIDTDGNRMTPAHATKKATI